VGKTLSNLHTRRGTSSEPARKKKKERDRRTARCEKGGVVSFKKVFSSSHQGGRGEVLSVTLWGEKVLRGREKAFTSSRQLLSRRRGKKRVLSAAAEIAPRRIVRVGESAAEGRGERFAHWAPSFSSYLIRETA